MAKRTNKDVLASDWNQEKLILTKTLRAYAKSNDTNQFDIALKLISSYFRVSQLYKHFIGDKGLISEFVTYFNAMGANYNKLFKTVQDFERGIADKILVKFGE
ncbi:MAG: hypothetical protein [Thorarchaeia virus VerdaV2]|uniref:Uncharacterized protein n=1 Tax=Thorarchaeia virus VerdaV2 TaxID=3070171 RepID=A0AA35CPK7_9CAUD|nr:MAG: hypothetical protein QIT42_gp19 [Thorarchaeia virus VerdaV2]BDI54913.1 MAG: hypothetical protein [Thorarchaeia virus VerdaV2]